MSNPDSHVCYSIPIGYGCLNRNHVHETYDEAQRCIDQAILDRGALVSDSSICKPSNILQWKE